MRRQIITLAAACVLVMSACGGSDTEGTTSPTQPAASPTSSSDAPIVQPGSLPGPASRIDLAPPYESSAALLAVLSDVGIDCAPNTKEDSGEEAEDRGQCTLTGRGTVIAWSVDLSYDPERQLDLEPGLGGFGEETPDIQHQVCEYYPAGTVSGPGWFVFGEDPDDMAEIATVVGGYLYQPDCATPVLGVCERDEFSGTRVFVTLSSDHLRVEPAMVPPGPIWLCLLAEEPGRATLVTFEIDASIDVEQLLGDAPLLGRDLLATEGITSQDGSILTVAAGEIVELGTIEMGSGRYLYFADLRPDASVDVQEEEMVGPAGLLTVSDS